MREPHPIPYVNLSSQWAEEKEYLFPIIEKILDSGQYVGGKIVKEFEQRVADICQTKHCVALNSGTDALIYGLDALDVGPGDEVITPPNSFIASTAAIVHLKAKPVFVDVLQDQNIDPKQIEHAISSRTKAIMPVHLTGRMARMDAIVEIAKKYNIPIIEDAAQAIGSRYNGIPSGKWGKIGCFSAHPLKNLNACGDAGFIVTDSDDIADRLQLKRNHGLVDRSTAVLFGGNSRIDALQAAILNYRISQLEGIIDKRRYHAHLYFDGLNQEKLIIPFEQDYEFNTYHTFVIQTDERDEMKNYLQEVEIETAIHYPIPIHLQPASQKLGFKKGDFPVAEIQAKQILTLPIHQNLSVNDIERIVDCINDFLK